MANAEAPVAHGLGGGEEFVQGLLLTVGGSAASTQSWLLKPSWEPIKTGKALPIIGPVVLVGIDAHAEERRRPAGWSTRGGLVQGTAVPYNAGRERRDCVFGRVATLAKRTACSRSSARIPSRPTTTCTQRPRTIQIPAVTSERKKQRK